MYPVGIAVRSFIRFLLDANGVRTLILLILARRRSPSVGRFRRQSIVSCNAAPVRPVCPEHASLLEVLTSFRYNQTLVWLLVTLTTWLVGRKVGSEAGAGPNIFCPAHIAVASACSKSKTAAEADATLAVSS